MRHITTIQKLCVLLLCLPLGVIYFHASTVRASSDRVEEGLVGNVRSVVTKHLVGPGFVTGYIYDSSGNLTESMIDNTPAGGRKTKYVFSRDALGLLKHESAYETDGSIIYRKLYAYSYDQTGKQTAMVASTEDGSFAHAEFSIYDEKSNLAQKIYFTAGVFIDRSIFDLRGNVVNAVRYKNGALTFESVKRYDSEGKLAESLYYGADGSLTHKDVFKYDDKGKLIEESGEYYNSHDLQKQITTYELDPVGNWIRRSVKRWIYKDGIITPTDNKIDAERLLTYY